MPLGQDTIKRAVDASGDDIRTFADGAIQVQAAALVGDAGEHVGIAGAPLVISDVAATFDGTGAAAETQRVALNVPGSLFEVNVVLLASVTASRWIHVHDASATISNGATPVDRAFIPAGGQGNRTYRMSGRPFSSGIVIALSTTEATTTLPGSGEAFFHSEFKAS